MAYLSTRYGLPTLLASIPLCLTYSVFGRVSDVLLVIGATCLRNRTALLGYLAGATQHLPAIICGLSVAIIGIQVFWLLQAKDEDKSWTGLGRPLLLPCRTTHSRMFPAKHSFSYSYLVVVVPVDWQGMSGGMISAGIRGQSGISSWLSTSGGEGRRGWFDVSPKDYLHRGDGHLSLREKLDIYLKSQGVDPSDYPHAYLVTAARFLGYHFNPVSFWYLYRSDKTLTAMILEVNNTFGERRMYFLPLETEKRLDTTQEGVLRDHHGQEASKARAPFTQAWAKDFHVSPFNSRKGNYSLTANNPWDSVTKAGAFVDNTIVLKSSKSHGKLVARLFSEGPAFDPAKATLLQKLRFLFSWYWVGFVTFPRIVKEAGVLFFKRKLHVWFRPEPLKTSMARTADATEKVLEQIFRTYLRHLVEQAEKPMAIEYIPSGVEEGAETMLSPAAEAGSSDTIHIEFKILTPVFYSRFVYYAHDLEALFCESQESCTVWISRPDILPHLVFKKPEPTLHLSNATDFAFFKAIRTLRRRPDRLVNPTIWPAKSRGDVRETTRTKTDIRGFRISSMDGFVLAHGGQGEKQAYRAAVLSLFAADRTAFGIMPLLQAQCFTFRVCLALFTSSVVEKSIRAAIQAR